MKPQCPSCKTEIIIENQTKRIFKCETLRTFNHKIEFIKVNLKIWIVTN